MGISDENQKRHEFQSILCSLAESQFKTAGKKEKADMYKRLEQLYRPSKEAKPYRHFYADIFNVFIKFEDGKHGSAEAVCLNLECIRQGYQAKNVDDNNEIIDISESLKKLYDHASLEMARISYTNSEKKDCAILQRSIE